MQTRLIGSKPWFVMSAITYLEDECLEDWHKPLSFLSFEWGSGGSTLWLSQRTAQVITLEHDAEWHKSTGDELRKYGIKNVELIHKPLGQGYAEYILRYPNESFDVIMVDGRERAQCIINAQHKLKKNGIFVLDNSERDQYQAAMGVLSHWERHDFDSGRAAAGGEGWVTTVWRRR